MLYVSCLCDRKCFMPETSSGQWEIINPKLQEVTAPFSDGTFVDDCGGGSDGEQWRCVKGTQLQGTQLQGQEITWQPGIIRATCALPGFGRNWH